MSGLVIRRAMWDDAESLWPLRFGLHLHECRLTDQKPCSDPYTLALMRHSFEGHVLDPTALTIGAWLDGVSVGYVQLIPKIMYGATDDGRAMGILGLYVVESGRAGLIGYRLLREAARLMDGVNKLQAAVAVANRNVHESLLARGAKPMAIVYQWEFDNGHGSVRRRDERPEAGEAPGQEGDRLSGSGAESVHGEPAVPARVRAPDGLCCGPVLARS